MELDAHFHLLWQHACLKKNMLKSCKISLKYVDRALLTAPGYGKGFGPLNHLVSFNLRKTNA